MEYPKAHTIRTFTVPNIYYIYGHVCKLFLEQYSLTKIIDYFLKFPFFTLTIEILKILLRKHNYDKVETRFDLIEPQSSFYIKF